MVSILAGSRRLGALCSLEACTFFIEQFIIYIYAAQ